MNNEDIHTCLPAKIISWDGERATVQPTLPKKLANGESLNAPNIVSVPICFPVADGGNALISVPLKAGDTVMLNFSERSLENWLGGSDTAPDDPRRFDLSDCFATPVVRPLVGKADTENVSMQYGSGSIKIAPSGDVTVQTGTFTLNATTAVNINTPQTTISQKTTVNGLLTFTQGMDGSTGSGGNAAVFRGIIDVNGEVISNGVKLSTHIHKGDSGGKTSSPL